MNTTPQQSQPIGGITQTPPPRKSDAVSLMRLSAPMIAQELAKHLPPRDLQALAQVAPSFKHAVYTPAIWRTVSDCLGPLTPLRPSEKYCLRNNQETLWQLPESFAQGWALSLCAGLGCAMVFQNSYVALCGTLLPVSAVVGPGWLRATWWAGQDQRVARLQRAARTDGSPPDLDAAACIKVARWLDWVATSCPERVLGDALASDNLPLAQRILARTKLTPALTRMVPTAHLSRLFIHCLEQPPKALHLCGRLLAGSLDVDAPTAQGHTPRAALFNALQEDVHDAENIFAVSYLDSCLGLAAAMGMEVDAHLAARVDWEALDIDSYTHIKAWLVQCIPRATQRGDFVALVSLLPMLGPLGFQASLDATLMHAIGAQDYTQAVRCLQRGAMPPRPTPLPIHLQEACDTDDGPQAQALRVLHGVLNLYSAP